MPYNIDAEIAEGDAGHVEHHEAMAAALNDLSGPAGLNTAGWGRMVFIPNGGTLPVGLPEYTLVVEMEV